MFCSIWHRYLLLRKRPWPFGAIRNRDVEFRTYVFFRDDWKVRDNDVDGGFSAATTLALPSAGLHQQMLGEWGTQISQRYIASLACLWRRQPFTKLVRLFFVNEFLYGQWLVYVVCCLVS